MGKETKNSEHTTSPNVSTIDATTVAEAPKLKKRTYPRALFAVLAVAFASVVAFAFWLATAFATLEPVCCADDAYISLAAKSLANGWGYASTVQSDHTNAYGLLPWDVGISTGPPIVVVGAVAYLVTGGGLAAPAQAVVLLNFLLSVAAVSLLPGSRISRLGALAGFWALVVALFGYNWEQVGAVLGELPAALMLVLSALCLGRALAENQKIHFSFVSGIALGLAVTSKTVAYLPAALAMTSLCGIASYTLLRNGVSARTFIDRVIVPSAISGASALVVIVAIELWKLADLGVNGYLQNWRDFFAFTNSVLAGDPLSLVETWQKQESVFLSWAGFPATLACVAVIALAAVALIRREMSGTAIALVALALGALLQISWWLLRPDAIPRYLFVGLFLLLFVFSASTAATRALRFIVPAVALGGYVAFVNFGEITYNVTRMNALIANGGERFTELRRVATILEDPRIKSSRPVVTSHWATAADIQYVMQGPNDFAPFDSKGADYSSRRIVAVRKAFLPPDSFPITNTSDCIVLFDGKHYLVEECWVYGR